MRRRVLAGHDTARVDGLALRKEIRMRFAGRLAGREPLHTRRLRRRHVVQLDTDDIVTA